MPLDFPSSPSPNQVYSLNGKSWKWNGDAWETYNDNLGVDFVETVNGATGEIAVVGGTDISVSTAGKTLTVNYTGSSSTNAVTSFNGNTGAVQGVSSANGLTGAIQFRGGRGITHTTGSNGISFGIDYIKGGTTFTTIANVPSSGYQVGTDLMLFQDKTGTNPPYLTNISNFLGYFLPYTKPISNADIPPSTSNAFLMASSGGSEGGVTFSDMVTLISANLTTIDGGTYA